MLKEADVGIFVVLFSQFIRDHEFVHYERRGSRVGPDVQEVHVTRGVNVGRVLFFRMGRVLIRGIERYVVVGPRVEIEIDDVLGFFFEFSTGAKQGVLHISLLARPRNKRPFVKLSILDHEKQDVAILVAGIGDDQNFGSIHHVRVWRTGCAGLGWGRMTRRWRL